MFEADIEKMADASEKKIKMMNRFSPGYLALSALAGAYLGFGIVLIFSVGGPLAGTQFAPFMKLIMGVSFGIALSLVIFAGSELFTGNNMVFAVGALKKRVGISPIIKLFVLCFVGNLIGSIFLAWLVVQGGSLSAEAQALIVKVAGMKMSLGAKEAFFRGILCNWLVCLAVWIANRNVGDTAKLIMVFWCLFAFISSGYEHSIANQSLMSLALLLPHGAEVSVAGFIHNQVFVTAGNIVGGGVMVGMVYAFVDSPFSFSSQKNDLENLEPIEQKER
ncbi:MAG: formate/nitrite transporter family protein [Nitrospina sp.]|jgi:nitrite transporter NirC|nr:formate/nitrite transporter family protein [Nitrospina sp.]MBT6716853.1 formate/nitrite transporter family protein [Nitrospina sp.]